MLTRRTFLRTGSLALLATPFLWRGGSPAHAGSSSSADLEILPRSAWAGDLAPRGPLSEEEVRFLLVHHTASGNDYSADDVPSLLRGFFEFHTSADKGWSDIAYNFLIDRYGRIWEGRAGSLDSPVAGDATGGNQGYAQLCCLIGDFTSTMPTAAALTSLIAVLAWLGERDGVDTTPGAMVAFESRGSNKWPAGTVVETATIAGHRDMSQTACPGDTFYPYVTGELMEAVTAMRSPVTTTTPTTLAPSTSSTAAAVTATTAVATTATSPVSLTVPTSTVASAPSTSLVAAEDPGDRTLGRGVVGVGAVAALAATVVAARKAEVSRRSGEPADE